MWVKDISDIDQVATSYFENIFTAGTCVRLEDYLNVAHHKVTDDMKDILTSEYSVDEIKVALFHMGSIKAPGPESMNALFYQKFWHIVGDDVVAAVLDILNSGNVDHDVNYTHIVLIPKIKSPEKMFNFKPISLCNVRYKIISKVLANKLKQILPYLISLTQSAFVPGCLITDNILVAYECLHAMHGHKKGKNALLL